jgi:hypothetical protein
MCPFSCKNGCISEDILCCNNVDLHTILQENPCEIYSIKQKTQGIIYLGVGKFPNSKNPKIYQLIRYRNEELS